MFVFAWNLDETKKKTQENKQVGNQSVRKKLYKSVINLNMEFGS